MSSRTWGGVQKQKTSGLTDEASELFNARLVLLLANHIGDLRVLREAVAAARAGLAGAEAGTGVAEGETR